jgi:lipopolysaccharide export system ATP-binding protein
MSALACGDLRLRLGGRSIVCDVRLSVGAGEVVGVLGPNGAGKSSFFELLAGLRVPTAGWVRLGANEVTRWPLHRRARAGLGYLGQRPAIFPALTALENVYAALDATGRPRAGARELLEAEGLGSALHQRADVLSGGQQRRLELARCLALRPTVILLDEPFAALDPPHVYALRSRLRQLARAGAAVLLTDHRVMEAFAICDRVILLDGGVVQFEGTSAAMAQNSHARSRYLGPDFPGALAEGGLQRVADVYNRDSAVEPEET